MATAKPTLPTDYLSRRCDIIEISTAIPMISRTENSKMLLRTLYDVSGSQKFDMSAVDPKLWA